MILSHETASCLFWSRFPCTWIFILCRVCLSGWGDTLGSSCHVGRVVMLRQRAELIPPVGEKSSHGCKTFLWADKWVHARWLPINPCWFRFFFFCRLPTPEGICSVCARSGIMPPRAAGKLRCVYVVLLFMWIKEQSNCSEPWCAVLDLRLQQSQDLKMNLILYDIIWYMIWYLFLIPNKKVKCISFWVWMQNMKKRHYDKARLWCYGFFTQSWRQTFKFELNLPCWRCVGFRY